MAQSMSLPWDELYAKHLDMGFRRKGVLDRLCVVVPTHVEK
jgi:hypothetical protein